MYTLYTFPGLETTAFKGDIEGSRRVRLPTTWIARCPLPPRDMQASCLVVIPCGNRVLKEELAICILHRFSYPSSPTPLSSSLQASSHGTAFTILNQPHFLPPPSRTNKRSPATSSTNRSQPLIFAVSAHVVAFQGDGGKAVAWNADEGEVDGVAGAIFHLRRDRQAGPDLLGQRGKRFKNFGDGRRGTMALRSGAVSEMTPPSETYFTTSLSSPKMPISCRRISSGEWPGKMRQLTLACAICGSAF